MQSAASIDIEIDGDSCRSRRQQINIEISKHTTIDRRSRRRIHRRPGAIGIDNGGVDDGTAGTVAECVRGKGSSGSGAVNLNAAKIAACRHKSQRRARRRCINNRDEWLEAAAQIEEKFFKAPESFKKCFCSAQAAAEFQRCHAVAAAIARKHRIADLLKALAEESARSFRRAEPLEDGCR